MKAKKIIGLFLCVAMVISMFAMTAAFAADGNMPEENVIAEEEVDRASRQGYYVNDNSGNRYYVYGYVTSTGANATVYTSFEIVSYGESAATANGRVKSVTAKGSAYYGILAGQMDSLGGTQSLTGGTNVASYTKTCGGTVSMLYGEHGFSCNGATSSFVTNVP